MPLARSKNVDETMKTIRICINSYENQNPVGTLYHSVFPQGVTFYSLTQLLINIEKILDTMEFPRASTERRRFTEAAALLSNRADSDVDMPTGELATFYVRMIFRQNASWQGTIVWSEGGCEEVFRSALEFIMLIDSAISPQ